MTEQKEVYVRLFDEGTECARPTQALDMGNGLFQLLAIDNYAEADEVWEFPPGSVVKVITKRSKSENTSYLLAVRADAL